MTILTNITTNLYDIKSLVSDGIIRIIGAILILLIGVVISKFISKLVKKVLHKSHFNEVTKRILNLDVPLEEFVSTIIKYIFYLVSVVFALQHIGLTTFIFNVILVAIFGLLVLFIILSLKDLIPNIAAGFLLHHRKFINKGENITVKDIKGKIIDITLTEIKLETKNKDVVIIPNSVLIKNEIVKNKT
ncbi:mechanosensitive ion channel [Candidatus Woesearchaeota archaeon]|nr:mechanosensitive ion channel [Candidatus Woesearchaeota archaeon]